MDLSGEAHDCDVTTAWQWAGVHFVQLNLFPGNTHRPVYDRRAPWNDPKGFLVFRITPDKLQMGHRTAGRTSGQHR